MISKFFIRVQEEHIRVQEELVRFCGRFGPMNFFLYGPFGLANLVIASCTLTDASCTHQIFKISIVSLTLLY